MPRNIRNNAHRSHSQTNSLGHNSHRSSGESFVDRHGVDFGNLTPDQFLKLEESYKPGWSNKEKKKTVTLPKLNFLSKPEPEE